MKKTMVAVFVAFLLGAAVWLPARAEDREEAGVRAAIEHYFRGHATGQGEHFRKAFHPEAKLFFIGEGKFSQLTSEEYIARASGRPAADEAQRRRHIESVDIAGNAAIAKVVLDYPQVKFTDYMSLLKVDGEWKIVNKTFYADRRPQPRS
jgi:hypothetical protein